MSSESESRLGLTFRCATEDDVELLVDMLADDKLGAQRENSARPLDHRYRLAFDAINTDPNNELVVVEADGQLAGMLQLTFIPYLTHQGSWRCLIEGVRVQRDFRGRGLGTEFLQWAVDRAKARNCRLVQLTTDKQRLDAIRFYEQMGFIASHEGFKLKLAD